MSQITVTLDVEDHRPGPRAELRFPTVTRGILDWLGSVGAADRDRRYVPYF